jgi:hypothetical protein
LFTFKRKLLKISVGLETALSAEANPAEGQCLEEQLDIAQLRTNADSFCERKALPIAL